MCELGTASPGTRRIEHTIGTGWTMVKPLDEVRYIYGMRVVQFINAV